MSRLTRDGTAEPVSRDQILRGERDRGILIFPVQLATCRLRSLLARLIHTLAICVTIHMTRDGAAEPVSRDQILRRERGQGNIIFPCSADDEEDWQPYPVDPYSCYMCENTYMQLAPRNLLTRWDVSSIPANGIFLTKN